MKVQFTVKGEDVLPVVKAIRQFMLPLKGKKPSVLEFKETDLTMTGCAVTYQRFNGAGTIMEARFDVELEPSSIDNH